MSDLTGDPRKMLPEEIAELHDEQGIPWPTWYSGPLITPSSPEKALAALRAFQEDPDAF